MKKGEIPFFFTSKNVFFNWGKTKNLKLKLYIFPPLCNGYFDI